MDLRPAWSGFVELHNRRQFGFDANPLAVNAITAWMEIMGFHNPDVRRELYQLITFLDDTWMSLYINDPKKKRKAEKGPNKIKGK